MANRESDQSFLQTIQSLQEKLQNCEKKLLEKDKIHQSQESIISDAVK